MTLIENIILYVYGDLKAKNISSRDSLVKLYYLFLLPVI